MKLRSMILLLALLCASVVQAQGICPQSTVDFSPPAAAIVQIIAKAAETSSYGTGTLIESDDPRGIVVTCAHMFGVDTESVIVEFPGGHLAEAEILYCDSVREIAILAIPPTSVEPIALALDPAIRGDIVRAGGYGAPHERYRTIGGPTIGYLPTKINYGESFLIPGGARQGDSGGPMLNERGELVGVVWGTSGCRTRGTYARRIRKILDQLFCRKDTPAMVPMVLPPATESPPVVETPPTDRLDAIEARLAELMIAITAIPAGSQGKQGIQGERGEVGQQGEQGIQGEQGLVGEPGVVATTDIDALVEEVLTRLLGTDDEPGLLPPLYIQFGSETNPVGEGLEAYLGDTLYLHGYLVELPE